MPSIGIIMPAYNAGPYIESVIERIPADVWPHVKGFWILNDGSRDDTQARVEALAKRHAAIRDVHFETNRVYGGTVWEGLVAARDAGVDFAVEFIASARTAGSPSASWPFPPGTPARCPISTLSRMD